MWKSARSVRLGLAVFLAMASVVCAAQVPVAPVAPVAPGEKAPAKPSSTTPASTTTPGSQGGESKSASGTEAKQSASGTTAKVGPLDPSSPPPKAFARPRIGLALGGGGAVALSEAGVLQWFEENHIPVDVMAGTSMGCMVSALYSTGRTPAQLEHVMDSQVFTSVFSLSNAYGSRSFRRREESRDLPNALTIGVKHGVSFRNAVLIDQGLNAFLDREFLRYSDQTDFNTLPIPLRCMSTDLNDVKAVTFARGSVPDAVRASVSLPGVFPPFEMGGHEYVDGGVLDNLPTTTVRGDLQADVVLAVSMPLVPVAKGELGSLLGVLGRSFAVSIEANEREERKLADVVIMPDITGFGATDYLKAVDLAKRGYAATEAHRAELLKYSLSDADWNAYLVHRESLIRGPAAPVLRVRVAAPDKSATAAIQRLFAPLVNQPVDTAKIEALLDQVRADGGYEADYTVGYETPQRFAAETSGAAPLPGGTIPVAVITKTDTPRPAGMDEPKPRQGPGGPDPKPAKASTSDQPALAKPGEPLQNSAKADDQNETPHADSPEAKGLSATQEVTPESLADIGRRPIILVSVTRKKTGPPFLLVGANLQAIGGGFNRATVEAIVVDQNFLSYGSELRSNVKLGYETYLATEYFHPLNPLSSPEHTIFAAPRTSLLREPLPIYSGQLRIAQRQLQNVDIGGDVGWTNRRTAELRAGIDFSNIRWETISGTDGKIDYSGQAQRVRLRYDYDTQDRALVPQFGFHVTGEAAYLYDAVASASAPQLTLRSSYARRFSLRRAAPATTRTGDPAQGREVFFLTGEGGTMFNRNVGDPFRFTLGGPLRLTASAIDQYRGTDYFLLEPAILRRIAQLPSPLGQSIYIGFGMEAGQIRAPGVPSINRQDAYFGIVAETPLGVVTLAPAVGSNGERKFVFTLGRLF